MRKISLYLISFVALFGLAFVIYRSFASEAQIGEETASEIAIVSTESMPEEESETVSSEESSVEEESQQTVSLPAARRAEETESDLELEFDSETEAETEWQGPVTTFLDQDGIEHSLDDNEGKPTLVNIWATWCPPCRDEMPLFEENYVQYGDEVNFVMLNALNSRPTETEEAALDFVESMGLTFPVYFDIEHNNQIEFVANMLPLTVLLDSNGEVVEVVRGQVSPAKLRQLLGKVIEI